MAYNLQSFIKSVGKTASKAIPGLGAAVSGASILARPKTATALIQEPNMSTNKGPVTAPAPNLGATATQTTPIAPATKSSLSPLGQQYASTFNNQGSTGGQAPLNPYNPTNGIVPPPTMPSGATNTPQPAAPKSTARDQYIAAYKAYQDAQRTNEDVTNAKKTYNDFVANQAKSIAGLEGQGRGIPLQIVRGTQEKLLGQTQPEAQRLQNEIAIAQQSQQGMVDAAKTEAELQKELLGLETADNKPVEVGGVLYQKQPDGSYKALTSSTKAAEGFTLGKDQVRYDAQGNLIAGNISGDTNGQAYTPGSNPTADAWVKYVQSGGDISKVPNEYQNVVAQGVANTPKPKSEINTKLDSLISDILSKPDSLNQIAGPIDQFTGGLIGPENILAKNKFNQLKALLSLDNIKYLKGTGAISDAEQRLLANAASAIGRNLYGTQLADELKKLQTGLQALGNDSTIAPDEEEYLRNAGYSPEEIQALKGQSFNSVGNTSASNIPQKNKNPGNIKAGGQADSLAIGVDAQGHLIFPNDQAGFKALQMELDAKINGRSKYLPANPTLVQLGKVYAEDPNWSINVAKILGVSPNTPTKSIPIDRLAMSIARQEGYFA